MQKYKHKIHYLFWLSFLLFSCNARTKNNAIYTDTLKSKLLIDSLQELAYNVNTDSAIKFNQQIKSLAKTLKDEQILFDTYCHTALLYSNSNDDIIKARLQIDSATRLKVAVSEHNRAKLALRKGMILKNNDSAVYYIKKALVNQSLLENTDFELANLTLARFFLDRKNYLLANQYAVEFLELNAHSKSKSKHADEIAMLNNLYQIKLGLKDTIAAGGYLLKAGQLNEHYFPNSEKTIYIPQNLGKYYLSQKQYDSSIYYFKQFANILKAKFNKTYTFYPYTYYAEVALAKKEYNNSKALLDSANSYLNAEQADDPFIQFEYFETLYAIEKALKNTSGALNALEKRNYYSNLLNDKGPAQQLAMLQEQLKEAEADKVIQAKQNKIEQQRLFNILLSISILAITSAAIGLIFYFRNRRQLEHQKLIQLQQKTELEKASMQIEIESKERRRIAQELHDEIGSTITSIGLAVKSLKRKPELASEKPLEILDRNSKALTQQAREIVWSMNESNDTLSSLVAYIHHHAQQFTLDNGFVLDYRATDPFPEKNIEGYKRRYIFQSVKEILNNAVKYSEGNLISLDIVADYNKFIINVADNGKGIVLDHTTTGNGLNNIINNIESIGGKIEHMNQNGSRYTINIPIR